GVHSGGRSVVRRAVGRQTRHSATTQHGTDLQKPPTWEKGGRGSGLARTDSTDRTEGMETSAGVIINKLTSKVPVTDVGHRA
ncbi:hypothetical protein V493_05457, partial [Pseudogymnoascus sp. VKM F-4281 (FW-2241)]